MSDLVARLTDDDDDARLAAILEAGEVTVLEGRQVLVEALVRRLWDDHPGIREAALDMLGRWATSAGYVAEERVRDRALELTADGRPGVRAEAVTALALLGSDEPLTGRMAAVLRLCDDDSPVVRRSALAAAGDLDDRAAIETIARHLDDPDPEAGFEAAFALASLGDDRGRPMLESALARAKRRLDACEGLRRLEAREAVPALRGVLGKWLLSWGDRLTVWATLHTLGEADAGAKVVERTRARRLEERAYALALVGSHKIPQGRDVLEAVAKNPKDVLQDTAVRSLGELADPSSAAVLTELLRDPTASPELRADIAAALARCEGRPTSSASPAG